MSEPCRLHTDTPAKCPRSHVCARCGETLSNHRTTAALCPDRAGGRFWPDQATLERFPEEYAPDSGSVKVGSGPSFGPDGWPPV